MRGTWGGESGYRDCNVDGAGNFMFFAFSVGVVDVVNKMDQQCGVVW